MAARKRSWWRRVLRALCLGTFAWVFLSVVLVLALRWVPPPTSGVRLERRLEALRAEEPWKPRHQWVPLEAIAPAMGVAVIAAEDQNFAEHFGFDWKAIEKAIDHNERSRRKRGASTLSQQTAKNLFLWTGRSWVRKGLEAYFTLLIEAGWPKRRILETYLNIVEFGDGIFGVEAAARAHFGKPASQLRPQEAALLAAVLPNPHKFKASAPSPYILGRQAWILKQMQQLGGAQVVKELK